LVTPVVVVVVIGRDLFKLQMQHTADQHKLSLAYCRVAVPVKRGDEEEARRRVNERDGAIVVKLDEKRAHRLSAYY
jgi:hypothetical protein